MKGNRSWTHPDGAEWLSYVYEAWVNRVPLLGGNDGGWANGNNYFGTNIETLIGVPALFQDLLGVDLLDQPWYRSAIQYQIYTWPLGSRCDGFGDGGEKVGGDNGFPGVKRLAFADLPARHFGDRYGAWYVQRRSQIFGGHISPDEGMAWHRLRFGETGAPVTPAPRFDLPLARGSRDVGVVAMHTDFNDISRNLMVAFRASPYGSFNHAHADQGLSIMIALEAGHFAVLFEIQFQPNPGGNVNRADAELESHVYLV